MPARLLNGVRLSALVCLTASVAACGMSSPPRDHAANTERTAPPKTPVTIYQAMAIALRDGVDTRTAPGGQSSAWSILDNGIATIEKHRNINDEAALKTDRQNRAAWAIARDVRVAWTRAAAAQKLDADIDRVLANTAQDNNLTASRAELAALKSQMDAGRNDLATLLNFSHPHDIVLQIDPQLLSNDGQSSKIKARLEGLEMLALVSRPEIAHATGETLDDLRQLRETTLTDFPAIAETLSHKSPNDTAQWDRFAANFTQGLVRIHTLPVTLKDDSSKALLLKMQKQSMTAAILTQVHVAYHDYQMGQGTYVSAWTDQTIVQENNAAGELRSVTAQAKAWLAFADLQKTEAVLLNSVGGDILPEKFAAMTVPELSLALEQRMEKDYAAAIDQWTSYAANQVVVPAESGVAPIPGLELVSYTPDLMLPLAQKLSSHTNSVDQDSAMQNDPSSFTSVSRGQIKSLLDASITEP